MKVKDETGHAYGRLRVFSRAENVGTDAAWFCGCECGKVVRATGIDLRRGHVRSCGCLQRETAFRQQFRHGHLARGKQGVEFCAFSAARQRCENPKDKMYHCYGGRGIRFLYASFKEFLRDVGRRPGPGYSLDRKNNNGNYEPGNCRWATRQEQRANMRPRSEWRRSARRF